MVSAPVLAAYRRQHYVYSSGSHPTGTLNASATRAALLTVQAAALADHTSGVVISSISYESGSASGTVTGNPTQILEITETLLAELDALADEDAAPPKDRTSFVSFRNRPLDI